MISSLLTIVISATLFERSALVDEWLDDTILPLGAIVARPAVCSAIGQVSRRCYGNASSS